MVHIWRRRCENLRSFLNIFWVSEFCFGGTKSWSFFFPVWQRRSSRVFDGFVLGQTGSWNDERCFKHVHDEEKSGGTFASYGWYGAFWNIIGVHPNAGAERFCITVSQSTGSFSVKGTSWRLVDTWEMKSTLVVTAQMGELCLHTFPDDCIKDWKFQTIIRIPSLSQPGLLMEVFFVQVRRWFQVFLGKLPLLLGASTHVFSMLPGIVAMNTGLLLLLLCNLEALSILGW